MTPTQSTRWGAAAQGSAIPRLRRLAPLLAVFAAAWGAAHERRILRHGVPLESDERLLAEAVGVADVERVRVLRVASIPQSGGRLLAPLARRLGFSTDGTAGMALRYGIYIRHEFADNPRLLAHELRHTAQYERLGGFYPFMTRYLTECLTDGYAFSLLEQDANDASLRAIMSGEPGRGEN